jgi:phosphatidylinositol glycan class K
MLSAQTLLILVLLLGLLPSPATPASSNYAVIISTSRSWFNYRHTANALAVYHSVKSSGIPDTNIILMLADDLPCNPRNVHPGQIFTERNYDVDLHSNVQVDYRGSEVNVENFVRVLTGRVLPGTPPSQRLNSNAHSKILLYMTGHGGDEFLKFQDSEEIASDDFAAAIAEMRAKGRYDSMVFITDTCQAGTLSNKFSRELTPDVFYVGSSRKGENSYAHHSDGHLGVAVIDRFTRAMLQFFTDDYKPGVSTMEDLLKATNKPQSLRANLAIDNFFQDKTAKDILLGDYFENKVGSVTVGREGYFDKDYVRPEQIEGDYDYDDDDDDDFEDVDEDCYVGFVSGVPTAATTSTAPLPEPHEPDGTLIGLYLASLVACISIASYKWNN